MTYPVAALYVDLDGPYPALAAECWDEKRDATRYTGPLPVIAHPPCGPWGRLYKQCTRQSRDLAITAVAQVRRFTGVLEHPADSKLWKELNLPRPGDLFPDEHGGRSYVIYQGDYGHPCPKETWLYAVGLKPLQLGIGQGAATGRICGTKAAGAIKKSERHLTPPRLAKLLCQWVTGHD